MHSGRAGQWYARSGVVVPEDLQVVRLAANRNSSEKGEQVARTANRCLADVARRVRAARAVVRRSAPRNPRHDELRLKLKRKLT